MIRGFTLLLVCFVVRLASAAESDSPPPNIVFIFADDLGYGDIGCYGADDIATPQIDRLADEGMRFTDFYAASPICSPSRAALLTGRYPVRMGINGVFFNQSFDGIDPEETTIAELLRDRGYRTGVVGKWHLGHHYTHLPLQNGFDTYFGIPYSNDMDMAVYLRGNEVETYDVDQRYMTRRYTEEAIAFMEGAGNQPFFLYLAHSMPHVPLHVSEDFEGGSQRGLYGDVIQELDWSVGQVLAALERLGKADNTIVVFTSDNGPWTVMKQFGGSAGPLREGKHFTFEGGMRVPTVVRWPGRIAPNSVSTEVCNMMDWFPTFARATGAKLPKQVDIDGKDLTAVLENQGHRADEEFFYFPASGELEAYRSGRWKLKLPYEGVPYARWRQAVAAHPLYLFDLENDPGETTNLAEAYPDLAGTMQRRMKEFLASMGPLPPSKVMTKPSDYSHFDLLGE